MSSVPTMHLTGGKTVRLGRVRPKTSFVTDGFRVVVQQDGTTSVAPRLGAHYDSAKDAAPPPDAVDWSSKAVASLARMYLNDSYGDCVIAGKYHLVGVWTGNDTDSGGVAVGSDQEVLNTYHKFCGPGDNGCNITDVLDKMKSQGIPMSGVQHKIDGYVSVDNSNQLMVKVALEVFGGLTLGLNLTSDCENAGPGVVWNFKGRIVGGHDVTAYGYNAQGVLISTWGKVGTVIPWNVFQRKVTSQAGVEECYAALSADWYGKDNLAPNGINVQSLKDALDKLGGGVVPDPTPVPPTPPNPPTPPTPPPASGNYNISLSGSFPSGLFGGSTTVTLTGKATPETAAGEEGPHHFCLGVSNSQPSLPWPPGTIIAIVLKVLPVVVADVQAGKSFTEIVFDVLAALRQNLQTEGVNITSEQWQQIIQTVLAIIRIFVK